MTQPDPATLRVQAPPVQASRVQTLRVQLLGPVRVWRGEEELALGGPRRRALLGMLASARQPVSRAQLIDGLWGHDAPDSAENSLHVHISGLRNVLEPWRERRAPSRLLMAVGPGYQLCLEPGALDTEVLDRHMADARRLAPDDPQAAARSLDAALGLWQGAALAGIPGPWADIERARLDELRRTATADRIDIMLALGRHHQAVAELAALIRQYPLQERFRCQLILALYRCGRQGDALAAFADARRVLAGQLGIDPGPALQRLHQQILTADAALDVPAQPARHDARHVRLDGLPDADAASLLRELIAEAADGEAAVIALVIVRATPPPPRRVFGCD